MSYFLVQISKILSFILFLSKLNIDGSECVQSASSCLVSASHLALPSSRAAPPNSHSCSFCDVLPNFLLPPISCQLMPAPLKICQVSHCQAPPHSFSISLFVFVINPGFKSVPFSRVGSFRLLIHMSQSPLRVEGNNMYSKTLLLFVCFCFLVVFMTIATAVSGVVAQPTLPRRRLSHHSVL